MPPIPTSLIEGFAELDVEPIQAWWTSLTDAESLDQVGHWEQDRFDYLLNHPELVLVWDPSTSRMHGICVAHPAARACWQSGSIPAEFVCPFSRGDCLMNPVRGRTLIFPPP